MQKEHEYRPEEPVDVGEIEQLRFNNVVFKHRNAHSNALDNISFEANIGDTIAFVGPSGSGKSTLVKLLVGLYSPVSGDVLYDNVSSKDIRYNRMRKQLGFVTQDTQLFSGTIRENMKFVKPDATDEEINIALEKASATNIVYSGGKGLDTVLGEGGKKVSGGEKQRLSIARAQTAHETDQTCSSRQSSSRRRVLEKQRQAPKEREKERARSERTDGRSCSPVACSEMPSVLYVLSGFSVLK